MVAMKVHLRKNLISITRLSYNRNEFWMGAVFSSIGQKQHGVIAG